MTRVVVKKAQRFVLTGAQRAFFYISSLPVEKYYYGDQRKFFILKTLSVISINVQLHGGY